MSKGNVKMRFKVAHQLCDIDTEVGDIEEEVRELLDRREDILAIKQGYLAQLGQGLYGTDDDRD